MPDFPLPLALFNFLPVAVTGVALVLLARLAQDADPSLAPLAWTGAALTLLGGLSKASWKLIAAASGADVAWLGNALFPLMAPGFALLALAAWGIARRLWGRAVPRGLPVAGLVLVLAAFAVAALRQWVLEIPRGWFLPLLVLASLGNLGLSLVLIACAARLRAWWAAGLVALNLAMIFALQPIAMASPKTLALHWLEQSLTALGTAGFALGIWLLGRRPRLQHLPESRVGRR